MSLELLLDAAEFWPRAAADIAAARDCVFAQALTFEGDAAGWALTGALRECPARDRRMLVDSFSRYVISDRLVHAPWNLLDRGLRREVRSTAEMTAALHAAGVGVRVTNPVGPLLVRFPRRNHKKLVLVDDRVAYIGGINFGEHNFSWRDLMLRIEDPAAVRFLKEDFLATWAGRPRGASRCFGPLELHSFDGAGNRRRFRRILDLIDGAQRRLYVECAYITSPFLERFREASRRGVAVTIVTPGQNNWKLVQRRMAWLAATSDVEVRLFQGRMTHMKAMLIDDAMLMVGSANFDMWSYHFQEELAGLTTDPAVVADFRERVMAEGLRSSVPCGGGSSLLGGRLAGWQLRSLERLALLVSG